MNENAIIGTWALLATTYALFASAMWWSRSDDCKSSNSRNSIMRDMLDRQFHAGREYRERILELEATITSIGKLCHKGKGGAK